MNFSKKNHEHQKNNRNIVSKTLITLFVALLISMSSFAQGRGINYKAVIKDDLGNILVSQPINIRFSILQSDSNSVYAELHNTTTDANGIIVVTIGEGNIISGDFFGFNWGNDLYQLQTEIDTEQDGTFEFLSTTQFNAVPYAYSSMDNLWQLNNENAIAIAEKVGIGESNPTAKLDVNGDFILQLGTAINEFSTDGTFTDNSNSAVPTEKAVKTYVDANLSTGLEAIDEGNGIGWRLKGRDPANYGNIGLNAVDLSYSDSSLLSYGATGTRATAMGFRSRASGEYSKAMGEFTTASGNYSTAMGYATIASERHSIAMGSSTNASGVLSTAMGLSTNASGDFSTAMGSSTNASGDVSTAMGASTNASGDVSTAMGRLTIASGENSTAMGRSTQAPSYGETAIGMYNTEYIPTSTYTWHINDRLFVIGNGTGFVGPGTGSINRNNALTVLKNGDAQFDGKIQHTSTGNANMIPIAYGNVESNGNVLSGTGNFTASVNAGVFTVTVTGQTLNENNSSCLIIPYSTAFRTTSIVHTNGDLRVYVFNSSGTLAATTFQFVIYKL